MNTLFIPFILSAALMGIIFVLALIDILSKKVLKEYPNVSFIIPAYKAWDTINETIDSLFSQDYPKDKIEVIVFASGPELNRYNFKKYKKNFIFMKHLLSQVAFLFPKLYVPKIYYSKAIIPFFCF